MAKKKAVERSSRKDTAGAAKVPVPVSDDEKRVRGKPVSLYPLSFHEALKLMVNTPPPKPRKNPKRRPR